MWSIHPAAALNTILEIHAVTLSAKAVLLCLLGDLYISHIKYRHQCGKCKEELRGNILRQPERNRRCGGLASWPQGVFWPFEWTSQCLVLSVLAQTEVWALYSSGIELSVSHSLKQSFSQHCLLFAVLPLHCLSLVRQQPAETGVHFNTD